MNLSKFKFSLSRDGIKGFFNVLIGKFGFKFRFHTSLDKRKIWLVDHLFSISSGKVISGLFEGMKLVKKSNWDKKIYKFNTDLSSKIVGCYEQEVQDKIAEFQKKNKRKYFVNFGAGEGYFTLGALHSGLFEKSLVFEISESSRNIMIENSKLNNLQDRLLIKKDANKNFLKDIDSSFKEISDIFLLVDIEGDEFNVFNDKNLQVIKNCNLIIEFHRLHDNKKNQEFIFKIKKYFNVEILTTSNRVFSKISLLRDLNDDDRWLIASENRPYRMIWLACSPK
ncbi:MAG: hypothetical protein CM1200mP13_14050 [Candidatus Pelagibacterales bacterium]|nr:MAG: hypothetical protein CM1200mP13_14050 [Pelagibacterales bacterium]